MPSARNRRTTAFGSRCSSPMTGHATTARGQVWAPHGTNPPAMRTPTRLAVLAALAASTAVPLFVAPSAGAGPLDPPEQCTDVESGFGTGECALRGGITNAVRFPCDYAWLPTCDLAAFRDPG